MKPYTLLYPKQWKDLKYRSPKSIRIIKSRRLNPLSQPKIKEKINKEWNKRKKENKDIFSGTLCRLSNYSIENGSLVLELGRTCYKELVGTNYLSTFDRAFLNYLKTLGEKEGDPYRYFSMALSVSGVVETKDNYVLITRRSKKVESCKNSFHTVAGQVEPGKLLRKSMVAELKNEAGLKENEYKLHFAALIINNQNFKPELIYVAKSKVNLADILLRKKTEAFESKNIFGLKKEDLRKFLNSFPQKAFCPPGLAAWQTYLKIENL